MIAMSKCDGAMTNRKARPARSIDRPPEGTVFPERSREPKGRRTALPQCPEPLGLQTRRPAQRQFTDRPPQWPTKPGERPGPIHPDGGGTPTAAHSPEVPNHKKDRVVRTIAERLISHDQIMTVSISIPLDGYRMIITFIE